MNQHDLWHPNPRFDEAAFRDRPALVVEDAHFRPSYADAMVRHGWFASAEPPERVTVEERGVDVASWDIALARDYQGKPSMQRWAKVLRGGRSSGRAGGCLDPGVPDFPRRRALRRGFENAGVGFTMIEVAPWQSGLEACRG